MRRALLTLLKSHGGSLSLIGLLTLLVVSCTKALPSPNGDDVSGQPELVGPDDRATTVVFPWGPEQVVYEVIDGYAVWQGDIALGPAPLGEGARAAIILGKRWPQGQVTYAIGAGTSDYAATIIRQALHAMENVSPLRFVEINDPCPGLNYACATTYVQFSPWAQQTGVSTIGMRGGQQRILLPPVPGVILVQHEMMHAVGVFHEHQRADRDSHVVYNPVCTTPNKRIQFNKLQGLQGNRVFGSYDIASIMHYSSWLFRVGAPEDPPCNGGFPLLAKPNEPCPNCAPNGVIPYASRLSAGDINILWAMYGQPLGQSEQGDEFGAAVVLGDFDGDDTLDLAVGAPGQQVRTITADGLITAYSGRVFLYKGTSVGGNFLPWKSFDARHVTGLSMPSNRFGEALASGDFNNDGFDDLAVGSPQNAFDRGAVHVLMGSRSGLGISFELTQAQAGSEAARNERFGHSLAAADINGDGRDDLAIGTPGDSLNGVRAGSVFLFRGDAGSRSPLAFWQRIDQSTNLLSNNPLGTNEEGERFGSAIALGRLDSDNTADIAVGSYCDGEDGPCSGSVYLYHFVSGEGVRGWGRLGQAPTWDAQPDDQFGWSVAIGTLGGPEVVVGAPGKDLGDAIDTGRAYRFRRTRQGIEPFAWVGQNQLSDIQSNERFGQALTISNVTQREHLLVGVPFESQGFFTDSGVVLAYGSGLPLPIEHAVGPWPPAESFDQFGAALAIGYIDLSFGGRLEYLVVGAPGEDNGAGAVSVYTYTNLYGLVAWWPSQHIRQETRSPEQ